MRDVHQNSQCSTRSSNDKSNAVRTKLIGMRNSKTIEKWLKMPFGAAP